MAKVNFGLVVTDARGKAGTVVYQHNRGGSFIRNKVKPKNPQGAVQQAHRALFKSIANRWSLTLTDNQRLPWFAFAERFVHHDQLGQKFRAQAQLVYVERNMVINMIGGTTIDTPPTDTQLNEPGELTAYASASTGQLWILPTNAHNNTTERALIWATKCMLPARYSFEGFWRLIGHD